MNNTFKESLQDKNTFSVTWELVPGRGAREKAQEEVIALAEQAAQDGRIHALTITDNPGGRPAISATSLGMEIFKLGIEPLVHFTCKDKNRNQIEAELYAMDRNQVRNLLVMTGDYPVSGFKGRPKPVFDLDPVHVLELISGMNQGLENHKPGDFFAGAVVSPFKAAEAELMAQYYKLKKKIDKGANFIVTQLGYDARKFHEVLQFIKNYNPEVSVIGNIYILPFGAGKMMNSNQLPGCVVTDKLLAELDHERTAEDKGKGARLLRAAKMYAFMKGMGFDGVHLGGHNIKYEDVKYIIEKGEELSDDWRRFIPEFDYAQPDGFYYYEKDLNTGLNTGKPVNRTSLPPDYPVDFNYRLMRFFHEIFFTPGKNLYPVMQNIYSGVKDPRKHGFEHFLKVIGNDCKDCGDCALLDLAYLCPMSQCPKNQRNGPCGGSYDGWCEVRPGEKKCFWVKVYAMLKAYNEENRLEDLYIPPVNWDLYQTSAWYNYYTGRDHSAAQKQTI
ncbi:methylenetetrahydrofolate reductase C-terminal domain-containing protein [Syntrophomonas palmitatica]|uniref:methylenetetrahydrofolate reductase C-terminal domain-containing protein n=1 Tax=Syntrophomonas palmitatica TaxID=402877 RepID=UPI0006D21C0D|nr:methylenetetrahydrofolate reductase C-terminal domain-containing protein [Syntrophomonas palmitatica]